jgi:hypothetical protein
MTAAAADLVEDFVRMRRDHEQNRDHYKDTRTLRTLVYWLGGESPVWEGDVYALADLDSNFAAKRVSQFLKARGLLTEDSARHRDWNQLRIEAVLHTLPAPLETEIRVWIAAQRGQGRWQHEPRSYATIRRYLLALEPVLTRWAADGVSTLREITADQLAHLVADQQGNRGRYLAISLRSLFRALK